MKNKTKTRKCIPLFAIPCFLIVIISLSVYFVGTNNSEFAEWITQNIGHPVRLLLAKITDVVPFSIAEALLVLSPVVLVLIIVIAAKRNGFREKVRFFVSILACVSILLSMYVYTLGIGYYRTFVSDRMALESLKADEANLYSTALILQEECERLIDEIEFGETGSSVASIDFDEMCDEVWLGYERLAADYPSLEIETFNSDAKQVLLSKGLTYLDILGIYTFFTGEANVNVHYPDYTTPTAIAHEFAHQRGVSRENEANFIAFLVCIRADDPYVRYSGYINMFEYVASALGRTNKELLLSVYDNMDYRMYGELKAFSDFYYANNSEILGNISNFFNDNYLKSQGTEGTVSYGLVVQLCVAYYCNE